VALILEAVTAPGLIFLLVTAPFFNWFVPTLLRGTRSAA
jgi:hypothetical protein